MLEALFDSDFTLYRAGTTVDAFGDESPTPALVGVERGTLVVQTNMDTSDRGSGDFRTGQMIGLMSIDSPVQINDLMKVTAGPELGTWWIAKSVLRPRSHHTEAEFRPYSGPKPT